MVKKSESPIYVGILVLLFSIITIVLASRILYGHTVNLLVNNLRERIVGISITAATHINAADLEVLQKKEDWIKPEWQKVVNYLHEVKYQNKDVVFVYIFRKTKNNSDSMEFIADADSIDPYAYVDVNRDGKMDPQGADKLQWPGQPYPEAKYIPEAFEAYDRALASKKLYSDNYGTVITGYAPIKDKDGNTVAVLATDMNADNFFRITRQVIKPFILFIIFLTFIISILVIITIDVWRKYSRSLERLSRERAEFVSITTHHIAAPLTLLKGYISMLQDENNNEVIEPNVKKRILNIIENSTERLISMISNFTDANRVDEEKVIYKFHSIDSNDLLNMVIYEFIPLFEKKGIKFTHSLLATKLQLSLDKEKFTHALRSVLNNSLRYTFSGKVNFSIILDNKFLKIKIEDTGVRNVPITPKKLILKFSEVGNQTEANIVSKDLALYVAKKTVEAHDGHFTVIQKEEHDLDEYMIHFLITLPVPAQ